MQKVTRSWKLWLWYPVLKTSMELAQHVAFLTTELCGISDTASN